ncbi:unnamed protein product [Thlaspi arvense]|uniref:Ubiquitin-like protease family profile domain-containing protein n=1 Tax=Thlaspi arvense TaxID=13288 RepID=A0AAU9RC28_THLAR|nr:unnamed protein product [Thlaspi arvense]
MRILVPLEYFDGERTKSPAYVISHVQSHVYGTPLETPVYHRETKKLNFRVLHRLQPQCAEFEIMTGHIVSNSFFLHLKVIMSILSRRRGEIMLKDKAAFVDTAFLNLVISVYKKFKQAGNKIQFDWGKNIASYITGKNRGKKLNIEFLSVVIDLWLSTVEILEAYVDHNDKDEVVQSYMEPLLESILWIMKRYLPYSITHHRSTKATWTRTEEGGDCRPCAANFLEMHALGLGVEEMAVITDKNVDRFREIYAMECYEEFVSNL